jgi:phosphoglucosamine mutase
VDVVGGRLEGLTVVLDCANGAASATAPPVFERLGASVTVIAADPDGVNINAGCGSTHPARLANAVVAAGADVGFAFDGDADRMVAVTADGEVVDGDHAIAIAALDLHGRGRLTGESVVVTVMSNLGFRRAMASAGIAVVETAVGDRHVLEALDAGGFVLGGEQSGHIIFRDRATTGDGSLSALVLAEVMVRTGRSLADLASAAMTRLPQVLRNVAIATPMPDIAERLSDELTVVEARLGGDGRVLVRPSGTEPVVRIMVEAVEADVAESVADRLVAAVARLG